MIAECKEAVGIHVLLEMDRALMTEKWKVRDPCRRRAAQVCDVSGRIVAAVLADRRPPYDVPGLSVQAQRLERDLLHGAIAVILGCSAQYLDCYRQGLCFPV